MLLARGEQKYHKEALRTRKQRNQERRMGIAAGGGDDQDNVVTQWLERTAPPPALSAEDCEVQHGALVMSRFSSALAACGRVDGMRASALTSVGRSALQMARETGQCTGTWPQTMARDAKETADALAAACRACARGSDDVGALRNRWELGGLKSDVDAFHERWETCIIDAQSPRRAAFAERDANKRPAPQLREPSKRVRAKKEKAAAGLA